MRATFSARLHRAGHADRHPQARGVWPPRGSRSFPGGTSSPLSPSTMRSTYPADRGGDHGTADWPSPQGPWSGMDQDQPKGRRRRGSAGTRSGRAHAASPGALRHRSGKLRRGVRRASPDEHQRRAVRAKRLVGAQQRLAHPFLIGERSPTKSRKSCLGQCRRKRPGLASGAYRTPVPGGRVGDESSG